MSHFEKVSYDQYLASHMEVPFENDETRDYFTKIEYNELKIPSRATRGSAGYDFYMPYTVSVKAHEPVTVPTGIKWVAEDEKKVLFIFPRSSMGFKYGMRMANTCCVIDADYWRGNTEGNILIRFVVDQDVTLEAGSRFAQGIILDYNITHDDNATGKRVGGVGSTGT